ncbi:sensor histidine kinase [Nitrospirillum sp. BR 11828]|uniref:sensor histidine kinase n=1 Tax=Nitrospirillum sp. BR 11828 TaxID=3104325 RepID=UPI002ACA9F45|nr:ATP-binding protein [Nitrospirillum sp. BR 11828]MDZ5648725.1 ATP-binding protein [Nitrospirillum sp. BR 11828]
MAFKASFSTALTLRVTLLCLSCVALGLLLRSTDYHATELLVLFLIAFQIGGVVRVVNTTNRELARFLNALSHSDFTQSFSYRAMGPSFQELGRAFAGVFDKFRAARADTERKADYLNVLVEHVPVALAEVHPDGRVNLLNNVARRLIGHDDLNRRLVDGGTLDSALRVLQPGQSALLKVAGGVTPLHLTVRATQLTLADGPRLLISLQNIGGELEATEVKAWSDLVRVLTHEMMNSLTPVSSLAGTAQSLLADLRAQLAAIPDLPPAVLVDAEDAGEAMDTVTRRAGGLLRFVERYRRFTQMPRPQVERLKVRELFARVERLMGPALAEHGVALEVVVLPPSLEISADPDLIDQVLINLVKNAVEALDEAKTSGTAARPPAITLAGHLDVTGHLNLLVRDNGPGIPPDVADKIFVPFYTTKREGSGIGLPLARQIMLAHGGTIAASPVEGGGTVFTLRF